MIDIKLKKKFLYFYAQKLYDLDKTFISNWCQTLTINFFYFSTLNGCNFRVFVPIFKIIRPK